MTKIQIKTESDAYDVIYDVFDDKEYMAEAMLMLSVALFGEFNSGGLSYATLMKIITKSPWILHIIEHPSEKMLYELSNIIPYYVACVITEGAMSDRILTNLLKDNYADDCIFPHPNLLGRAIEVASLETIETLVSMAYNYWDGEEVLDPFISDPRIKNAITRYEAVHVNNGD